MSQSPFPSIPIPSSADPQQMFATVMALRAAVNLFIVDASNPLPGSGFHLFANFSQTQQNFDDLFAMLSMKPYLVGALPLPANAMKGARSYVTDALAPTFLSVLVGGGSIVCPAFNNGVAWVAG